jgi:hypothetical protein
MARGYLVANDPSLVTLRVTNMQPAMSFLQLLLVVLAAVWRRGNIRFTTLRLVIACEPRRHYD